MRYTKTNKKDWLSKQLNTVENTTIYRFLPIWHRRTSVRLYKTNEDTHVHKKQGTANEKSGLV